MAIAGEGDGETAVIAVKLPEEQPKAPGPEDETAAPADDTRATAAWTQTASIPVSSSQTGGPGTRDHERPRRTTLTQAVGERSTATPRKRPGTFVLVFWAVGLSALLLVTLAAVYIAAQNDSEPATTRATGTGSTVRGPAPEGVDPSARVPGKSRIELNITPRTAKIMVDGKPHTGDVLWLETSIWAVATCPTGSGSRQRCTSASRASWWSERARSLVLELPQVALVVDEHDLGAVVDLDPF